MKPVLLPNEWAQCRAMADRYPGSPERAADEIGLIYGRAGVAAWALEGADDSEPWFTREMLDAVYEVLGNDEATVEECEAAQVALDRIAALLPPREGT